MVNVKPPDAYAGSPALVTLPAGTILFRVHLATSQPDAFSQEPAHRYYGGGRFDATDDDRYPYLYAGESAGVAIAETLLRDLLPDDTGVLLLPFAKVRGRRLSAITTTADLGLVSLRSARDLAAVCQDTWLTTCDQQFYAQSRHWAHWIRAQAPGAAGYTWRSKREPDEQAFVLFGDRIPAGTIIATTDAELPQGDEASFDSPRGRRALRNRLVGYNAAFSRR